jgi:hypothetical protein
VESESRGDWFSFWKEAPGEMRNDSSGNHAQSSGRVESSLMTRLTEQVE